MHKNVQKAISDGMEKTGDYSKEDNVLKKADSETGFTIRLHFAGDNADNSIMEEIQKLLTETYIKNLTLQSINTAD